MGRPLKIAARPNLGRRMSSYATGVLGLTLTEQRIPEGVMGATEFSRGSHDGTRVATHRWVGSD